MNQLEASKRMVERSLPPVRTNTPRDCEYGCGCGEFVHLTEYNYRGRDEKAFIETTKGGDMTPRRSGRAWLS